ncbi:MAG: hypothetical protein U5L45_03670 [Saprospiraceae bacterium]|nr:hypothetical protein [Saprospiraceae bacterium]
MVHFSASPKNEPPLLPLRARSARKTSVFNQKTMFLGYAHSSNNRYFSAYPLRSLRSRKGRRGGSFFGLCPKNEPHALPRASEASAKSVLKVEIICN